jgi:hypothetical protein
MEDGHTGPLFELIFEHGLAGRVYSEASDYLIMQDTIAALGRMSVV